MGFKSPTEPLMDALFDREQSYVAQATNANLMHRHGEFVAETVCPGAVMELLKLRKYIEHPQETGETLASKASPQRYVRTLREGVAGTIAIRNANGRSNQIQNQFLFYISGKHDFGICLYNRKSIQHKIRS